jgi:hypothetical protein
MIDCYHPPLLFLFMKKIIFAGVFILGIAVGYIIFGLFPKFIEKTPVGTPQLSGRIVLFNQYDDGSLRETGVSVPYDITGTYPGTSLMQLSPDKTKVVYTAWENAHVVIYVAGVNGIGTKKIAEQKVPEGSGGLDVNSIKWSEDGTHITYVEDGLKCMKKNCVGSSDFTDVRTTYSVDVNNGNQSIVNGVN